MGTDVDRYRDLSRGAGELWFDVCRQASAAVRRALEELPTRREREPGLGVGHGGDETTAADGAAERAILAELEPLHSQGLSFTVVSEEMGERVYGDGSSSLVLVVDPIDGSNNAKRTIPFFSVSIAVAEGAAMENVVLGYVYDFGTGEEWTAVRGGGARLNGVLLEGPGAKEEIEILSLEATRTASVARSIDRIVGLAERLRIMGSLALSLCHLAAGRTDAVLSLKPIRSVDVAAGQLLVRECGYAIELPEAGSFARSPLDVVARSRVVAARTPERCEELFGAVRASLPLDEARRL